MKEYVRFLVVGLVAVGLGAPAKADVVWKFETEGKVFAKPLVTDNVIYAAAGKTLYAIDMDGGEVWRRSLGGEVAAQPNVTEEAIYVHSSQGLHALGLSGDLLWEAARPDLGPLVDGRTWGWGDEILPDPWGWYRSAPLVEGELVLFGTSDGVSAVSRADGTTKWHLPVGPVTGDLARFEELVVAASWNGSVYGIEAETGKIHWRFRGRIPTPRAVDWEGYKGFHLTPVVHQGNVYVGNRGTFFYAIDARKGTEKWSSKVGASWIGSPAVIEDGSVYYGLSDGMAVLGFDAEAGAQNLFFQTGAVVFAQPEVFQGDLIVGTLSGHLYRVDLDSGVGDLVVALGPEVRQYAEFFQPENIPAGLTNHQSNEWSVEQMLVQSNAILNIEIAGNVVLAGTGSGALYAIELEGEKAPIE